MKRLIRALTVAALVTCAVPVNANAGEYVVHSCRLPDGRPAPVDAWVPIGNGAGASHSSSCPGGGELEVSLWDWPQEPGRLRVGWRYDAGLAEIRGASVVLSGSSARLLSGGGVEIQTEPRLLNGGIICSASLACIDRQVGFAPADFPAGTHTWSMMLGCFSPSLQMCVGDPISNTLGRASVRSASFTLGEDVPPRVSAARGSLAASPAAALPLVVRDDLSGVSHASVEVDGREVPQSLLNEPDGSCKPVGLAGATRDYTQRQPCPLERRFELSLAQAVLSEGSHTLRARVFDAAGNATDIVAASRITVKRSGLVAAQTRRLTSSFGRFVRFTGALSTIGGDPLTGVDVTLRAVPDGGVRRPPELTSTTDSEGRYAFSFQALANAVLQVVDSDGRVQRTLRLTVRSTLQLRAKRQSIPPLGRMTLHGRIPTVKLKRGVNVAIKVRSGRGWRTVGVTRSDVRGEFEFDYRFRATRRGRFHFRAVALPSSDLPVKALPSKVVSVRVG